MHVKSETNFHVHVYACQKLVNVVHRGDICLFPGRKFFFFFFSLFFFFLFFLFFFVPSSPPVHESICSRVYIYSMKERKKSQSFLFSLSREQVKKRLLIIFLLWNGKTKWAIKHQASSMKHQTSNINDEPSVWPGDWAVTVPFLGLHCVFYSFSSSPATDRSFIRSVSCSSLSSLESTVTEISWHSSIWIAARKTSSS